MPRFYTLDSPGRTSYAHPVRRIALLLATAGAAIACAPAHASTVWLCFPGQKADPCTKTLTFTAVAKDGSMKRYTVGPRKRQPVDCFYVYPSVSTENRGNSDLKPGFEETDTARLQASWFSPICRVFAPMYRQVTTHGDGNPYRGDYALEWKDVLAAWREYLARDNHGRGVVLIGHSEGAFLLKRLIRERIEDDPKALRLLVSAVLLGGNVTVGENGDFRRVRPCAAAKQFGCVVAYSSWDRPPPANASFEHVDNPRQHVLCVNPGAPGGGPAPATPIFLTTSFDEMGGVSPQIMFAVDSDWVSYPGLYRAECKRRGGMAWLQITPITHGDRRPTAHAVNGAGWGLHPLDVNIALFELVGLVGSEATAYLSHR
jgi:hypothetical protein